ncbi:Uncharacterised protein [Klebsiella pneumoniae subsp. ozaenae]|uniref:Uncharacterized protein n=1 Tax=Klebsiella pneumoniae subsp. ozaenae TaxID=574 RepID=A0A377YTH5_KLEPO|nr:Uncharacterised protein [Klebsiella pneumoniae subsp. ozaenae]
MTRRPKTAQDLDEYQRTVLAGLYARREFDQGYRLSKLQKQVILNDYLAQLSAAPHHPAPADFPSGATAGCRLLLASADTDATLPRPLTRCLCNLQACTIFSWRHDHRHLPATLAGNRENLVMWEKFCI